MQHQVRIHYDNKNNFYEPVMWAWAGDGATKEREVVPAGEDEFGLYFDFCSNRSEFNFLFKDGKGKDVEWEEAKLNRYYHRQLGAEAWTMAGRHHVYHVPPAEPQGSTRAFYRSIKHLILDKNYYFPSTDVSGLEVPSLLGANLLKDGSILFGFFHPYAARVYLVGNFNDWQCPAHPSPQPDQFIEMGLYRGFYNQPNIWLTRIKPEQSDSPIEYKYFVQGGARELERYTPDPYTRVYSDDYKNRNSIVLNPTTFPWSDQDWRTPDIKDLIIYELNIYGFTDNDPSIPEEIQGTFKGVTWRIRHGYFDQLGVTALELMPVAEVPRKRGLGYEPCTFMAVEKDFGSPDDFREMVNEAHRRGLAVIVDEVFNHTSNDFNPLWDLIDDGSGDGGFYFEGKTMWGNKVATGKDEVDNMLIDACKLLIREYHVDGFRFDATHSYFLNHKLLHRLAHDIKDKGFKPDTIIIAENLPNEQDINLEGYNGYAQWSNIFHDKMKAMLREGTFEGVPNTPDWLGDPIYFSKMSFAAHTNNAINFVENHDENSVQFEVASNGITDPAIKNRKARLGLMVTMTSLGQPMIYMGQEYGIERERNRIDIDWVKYSEHVNDFYNWTCGLINLRKRYSALRHCGYNPADEGEFTWILGPWFQAARGGGKRLIGWRLNDSGDPEQRMAVLLNFENQAVPVELELHTPGRWVKLADIDTVNDLPPAGNKNPGDPDSLVTADGLVKNYVLPAYSGFIYKYVPETS